LSFLEQETEPGEQIVGRWMSLAQTLTEQPAVITEAQGEVASPGVTSVSKNDITTKPESELHANQRPLKETDPEGYQRAVKWLEQQRDEKAAWLEEAEQVLTGLEPDDPSRERGIAKWREGLKAYERLCKAIPKPPAEHCLDCNRPSPRGLTPCDACAQGAS
jgi:hypothetical protein